MSTPRFRLGDREVDLVQREIRDGSGVVPLTANEVGLLTVLFTRAGEVVSREELLTEGLGYRRALQTRAIDQAIWRLRRKLEDEPQRPVYLRSEPNVGYWLVMTPEPERAVRIVGRRAELAEVQRWLEEDEGEVWLVGLPGSGRRTLASHLSDGAGRVHAATRMPTEPSTRALRLGLLPAEEAATLLVDRVLAGRGSAALAEGEAEALEALVQSTGGHPATLAALAEQAVLRMLPEVAALPPPEPDAELVSFVRALPSEVLRAASALAEVPDALPAPEAAALLGPAVVSAWRASAVEAFDRGSGRWFVVAPPVRRALRAAGITPAAEDTARLVEHARTTVLGLADRLLETGSTAEEQELRQRAATVRWLVERTADPALLRVLLARPIFPLPPLPDPGDDPDAQVCHELLLAGALEWTDPVAWAERIDALADRSPSPPIEWVMLQHWLGMLSHTGAPPSRMAPALERMARGAEQIGTPFARAMHLLVRGQIALQENRTDQAVGDLVAALRLFEQHGARFHAASVRSNLAATAARDGRYNEAIAWLEEVLQFPVDTASEEGFERMRLAEALTTADRIDEARRQIALAEALGIQPEYLEIERAWCDLVGGHPERAEIRARVHVSVPIKVSGFAELTVAWARLLQGEPADALSRFEALDGRWQGDPLDLSWAKFVASAAAGRPDDAERLLSSISGPRPAWWSRAEQVASAWLAHARGEAVDCSALARVRTHDRIRTVGLMVAIDALLQATGSPPARSEA